MNGRTFVAKSLRFAVARMVRAQHRMIEWADRLDPPRRTLQEEMVARWYAADGENTLRYDYDLTPDSIVFDLGAFEGEWALGIVGRYGSRVFAFESMPKYFETLRRKLGKNPKIRLLDYGLASSNRSEILYEGGVGSSTFHGDGPGVPIRLRAFEDFVKSEGITEIDLLKINIEGGEYEVLEHLLDTGVIRAIDNLQIQFHDFVPNAAKRREQIRDRLRATHQEAYCFDFVWEGWRRLRPASGRVDPTDAGELPATFSRAHPSDQRT